MAEQVDEEERAWATRVARAFLAPASRERAPDDEGPPPVVVLAVAVVPLPVPQAMEEDEEGRDG